MRTVIRFKRYLSVEAVPGDGVYLFSERPGQTRLHGELIERMAPLLDGGHDRGQIVAALGYDFAAERVERAIDRLVEAGHVVEAHPDADPRAGGFWEMCGLDGDTALRKLAGRGIKVTSLGGVSEDDALAEAARSFGLLTGVENPDLNVVLVDDYLNVELAEYNRRRLDDRQPWLLARPVGATIWVGPVFEPGRTACWMCLANRLSTNQLVLTYLRQRTGRFAVGTEALADVPAGRQIAAHLTALHAARWLSGAFSETDHQPAAGWAPSEQSDVVTLDTVTLTTHRHVLRQRPQCPACGDTALQARLQKRPVTLTSRLKSPTWDGGHRARSQEALLAEQEPLISPITGVVKQLVRVPSSVEGLYTYNAGQNFAVPMAGISDLRAGLRSSACGKGMTDIQAKASAIGEAIERYSGLYRGDEAKITASLVELGDKGIHPNDLALYSERQFAERDKWNAKGSHFQQVCDPFDPNQQIDWTPVWSLSREETRYLPTASLFFGYPMTRGNQYAGGDSNGNAAGTCLEDAIVQGFMELVERDSVAIWWYNMLRRPAIDLSSFDEPYFRDWQQRYRAANRETWALDLTTDLGVPTVVTVSRRVDKPVQDILISFGAHFDVKIAISRAMTEMNQFLPAVINVNSDSDQYAFPDPDQHHWWRTATVENQPYLLPSAERPRTADDFTDPTTDDLAEDVRLAQRTVENAGLEMLVIDQTRPDIAVPVVKVLVPGMRHFWTRFAPGRLYDVPLSMGWLAEPTAESDLNPIGMFL